MKTAKSYTKSVCSDKMWKSWSSLPKSSKKRGGIGLSRFSFSYYKNTGKGTLTQNLYISPSINNARLAKHTAWHECAHAKTNAISTTKVKGLSKEISKNFKYCKNMKKECLADAMAYVKTKDSRDSYYLRSKPTKAQISTAKKVWNASGKVYKETKTNITAYNLLKTF